MAMEFVDEEGIDLEDEFGGEEGGYEHNKKVSFFVIDGSAEMVGDGGEGSPLRKALKAVYSNVLKVGCSGKMSHLVGIIFSNTANSHPSSALVDKFFEFRGLDYVGQETAVAVKELLHSKNLKKTCHDKFGGHGSCDLASLLFYARSTARKIARSNRQLAVTYITNCENPFGKNPKLSTNFKSAHRHANDLRKHGGQFSVAFVAKDETADLSIWKELDPTASLDGLTELESNVYQKGFTPRAYATLPLQLGPDLSLQVQLFTLAAETKKPSPMYFDAETEQRVFSRTVYRPKEKAAALDEEGEKNEIATSSDAASSSTVPALSDVHRSRSQLQQALRLGGQTILFSQEEIAALKAFQKGITLLGFKSVESLKVDRHVEQRRFLYPAESTQSGSRRLFRSLLSRLADRGQMMVASMNVYSHSRPRLVALVPQLAGKEGATRDGFSVVSLALADDCIDTSLLVKDSVCPKIEEDSEQAAAADQLVKRLTASYTPFENPHLQSFYTMLVEYAVGEKPKEIVDTIKPFFSDARRLARVQPQLDEFKDAFDLNGYDPTKKATKRATATKAPTEGRAKRTKLDTNEVTLEQMAKDGTLSRLTVADLRDKAAAAYITITSAQRKKDDVIAAITAFYS